MNVRIAIVTSVIAVIAALAAPRQAAACSCVPPPPPKEAMASAAAVFEGTVTGVRAQQDGMSREVELQVGRRFKGAEADKVTVITAESSAACGYNFEVGGTYLVYAGESEGQLAVSLCSRTARVEDAAADIAALGGDAPSDPASPPEPLPPVEPGKGGCAGCSAGAPSDGAAGLLLVLAAVALARRRRA
jgi:MYXO-CTERM domain-containing protein